MDRGAWQATVHGIPKIQIRLKQLSMHARLISWNSPFPCILVSTRNYTFISICQLLVGKKSILLVQF